MTKVENASKQTSWRLFLSITASGLSQIIGSLTAIVLVPLFLYAWGVDQYGRWLSLTAIISYLGLLDLGGQNYIGNLLARNHATNNTQEFKNRFDEGVSLFSLIAFGALILLLLSLAIPGLAFPGDSSPLNTTDRLILLFMGASFLLSIPQGVYVVVYRSTGQYVKGMVAGITTRFAMLLFYIWLLVRQSPPLTYAIGYFGSIVVLTLVVIIYAWISIPPSRNLHLSLRAAWAGRVHLKGSLHFWLLTVANAINLQGVILLLSANVQLALVAVYATHRTVSSLLAQIGSVFMSPIWPEMSFMTARGEHQELVRLALGSIRIVTFLSALAAVVIWVVIPLIYSLWTNQQLELQPFLLAILLLQNVLAAGWNTASWSLLASNHHEKISYLAMANAVVTILLAIWWAPLYGVIGVALATLTGDVLCGFSVYPWLAARHLSISGWTVYRAILIPILATFAGVAILFAVTSMVNDLALKVILGILVALGLFYPISLLALGRDNLNWLLSKLREMLGHKNLKPIQLQEN